MDYFDRVVGRLELGQTLYTTTTGIPRIFCGIGNRLGQNAILYSYLKYSGKIQRTFLNEANALGYVPDHHWCFAHGMDRGCSYRVTLQILTDYPNP
jgi:hypothetical protein